MLNIVSQISDRAVINDSIGQPSNFTIKNVSNNLNDDDSFLKQNICESALSGSDSNHSGENRDQIDHKNNLNHSIISTDKYLQKKLHLSFSKLKGSDPSRFLNANEPKLSMSLLTNSPRKNHQPFVSNIMNKSFTNIRGMNKNKTFLNITNNSRSKFPENEVFSKSRGRGSSSFENAANTGTSMNQTLRPNGMIHNSGSSSRLLNASLLSIRGRGRGANRTLTRHDSYSFNSLDKCNSILKISSEMASFC